MTVAKKTPKQIVEESVPGLEVVQQPASPVTPDAARRGTRPGPSMAELKKKFLGDAAAGADAADAAADSPAAEAAASKVRVFQTRPKQAPADPADDPGPRTFLADDEGLIGGRG